MSSDINVQTFSGKVNITSNLLVGSSHLFVDTINNRVGLVTNTPDAGLHVNSNAYVHTNFRVGSGIVMNDTTGRITAGSFVGDGSAMTGINSDSGSWVNGTDVVHLATTGDKVGIGVVDPQYKLDINGTTQFRAGQLIRSLIANNVARPAITDTLQQYEIRASAGNPDVNLASGHGFLRIGAGGAMAIGGYISYIDLSGYSSVADMKQNIVFGTSSAERMRITHDGNVGIGTSSPGAKLDVNGGVILTGGTHGSRPTNDGGVLANAEIRGGPGVGSAGFLRLAAGGYNNGSASDATSKSFIDLCGYSSTSDFDRNISFHTLNQERMRINLSGNVGIGTTSPTELLDITAASGDYDAFIRLRSGSGGTSPVTESGLKLTESGEYGFQFAHSAATDLLKIRHQNSTGAVDLDDIMVWNPNGNVGIGTTSPAGTLHVQTDSSVHITAGTVPAFTGIHTTSTATGRAQLVLSSNYSDLVIASSQINNNHGSTLSFATVNPSNTAEYRKFVINQGNWGSRKDFLDFGLSASAADQNPHSSINSTDTVLTLDGNNKRVGIGTISPTAKLHVDAGTGVATRITGATQWTNRPFAMMGRTAGRTYAPNVVVCNVTGYNSGIANTSNGRFTAPTGFSGYYFVTFSGLAGAGETGPNDRWYKNGADIGWGSSHVNSSSLTPSRWGMSAQFIIYLNAGDYLEHRVITGSLYGSSQIHSTHTVMYLHS